MHNIKFMSATTFSIPVTIITGFLGSGKTTFINDLTAKHPGKKFAIIENEFGAISIDQELLVGGAEGVFEIKGGCICCTVSEELIKYLLNLNKDGQAFDHLIIETTGIAEPLSIGEPFLAHPLIQQKYQLDGIVCLVDSEGVEDMLQQEAVVAKQISAADLIIFNKTDVIATDYLLEVESRIRQINPLALTVRAQYGRVDYANLLNLQANTTELMERLQQQVAHDHQHLHQGISSWSLSFTEPLDYAKFYQWASMLMMFQSSRIYRIKGILNFSNESTKTIFQSVKNKFVMTEGSAWPAEAPRGSKLVFIGRELKKEQLMRQLKQSFAK